MTTLITSSTTLIWRIFIPTFYTVFFGIFILVLAFGDVGFSFLGIPVNIFRFIFVMFYVLSLAFIYRTMFQLKRIDVDADAIYVTDYLKNFRYPISDIEMIKYGKSIFKPAELHFKAKGTFGKVIYFLPSPKKFNEFQASHPELTFS